MKPYHKITTSENGIETFALIQSEDIDLVVSDVMMPEMDGFEFCTKVKSEINTSHIPVILLTALTSTESKIIGLDKGADAYISKPFKNVLLIKQVNNLLWQRKQLRKSFQSHVVSGEEYNPGNLDNYFPNKANDIIDKNIQEDSFTVEKLTGDVFLSRSQLHRKLKQLTNYSATEYIRVYRLKKAALLLKSKETKIDEVSYLTGFCSHSHFTKCFKDLFNMPPIKYHNQPNH